MWHLLLPICLTLKEVHCGCRGDLIRTAPETQWNCLVSPKHRRRSCLMMLVTACPCCNSAGSWRWKLEVFRGNGPMTSFELTAPCLAQDFSKRFQKGRLYGLSTTHALTRPSLRPRIGEAVNFFFKYNSKAIAERRTEYVTGYSELREILTNSPKAELQRQENHSFQRHFGANFTQLLGKGGTC